MTARQLLDILRDNPGDHEKFARKSRIEEIVEGATATIDFPLYTKIIERSAVLLEGDFARGDFQFNNTARCSGSINIGVTPTEV